MLLLLGVATIPSRPNQRWNAIRIVLVMSIGQDKSRLISKWNKGVRVRGLKATEHKSAALASE